MVAYIRKPLLTLTILISIVVFIGNAYAPEPKKYKVWINIRAGDEDKIEQDIVESHLKRELRALGNIVIVDINDEWDWNISIVLLGHHLTDGSKTQRMSIGYTYNQRVGGYEFVLNKKFLSLRDIPVYNYDPGVYSWHKDDLPAWCILLANAFDKLLKAEHQ